jgi:hypothetical protein
VLGAIEGPPAQLAVSPLDGLPHFLVDRHSAQHARHAGVQDAALFIAARVEQVPSHVLERATVSHVMREAVASGAQVDHMVTDIGNVAEVR